MLVVAVAVAVIALVLYSYSYPKSLPIRWLKKLHRNCGLLQRRRSRRSCYFVHFLFLFFFFRLSSHVTITSVICLPVFVRCVHVRSFPISYFFRYSFMLCSTHKYFRDTQTHITYRKSDSETATTADVFIRSRWQLYTV